MTGHLFKDRLEKKRMQLTELGIELFEKLKYAIGVLTIAVQNKQKGKHIELTRLGLERLEKKLNDILKYYK